eukprot:g1789.t1
MRSLGYPRIISVENFRTPNFALVADTLYWMVHKYDPNIMISDEITTQSDRVNFISRVVKVMNGQAQLKLHPKRLYAANGKAVRELLKFARLLHAAQRENMTLRAAKDEANTDTNGADSKEENDDDKKAPEHVGALDEIVLPQMHNTKALANEITSSGAKLFDLLGYEEDLREKREKALRFLDAAQGTRGTTESGFLEKKVQELIMAQEENIAAMAKQCADLEHDERTLAKKIKKKKSEVERSEKRLSSLQNVRPAFMDELEKLEDDLKKNYSVYLERYRNLDYLEKQLDAFRKVEKDKLESAKRNLKRLQQRLQKRGERLDRGTNAIENAFDDEIDRNKQQRSSRRARSNVDDRDDSSVSDHSSDTPSVDSDEDSDLSDRDDSVDLSSSDSGDDGSDTRAPRNTGARGRSDVRGDARRGDSSVDEDEDLSDSLGDDDGSSESDDDF